MPSVGIGGSVHDFATCVINERGEMWAIEDERISRVRYALFASNPCELSFPYVLESAGITIAEIDEVVGNDLLEPSARVALEGNRRGPVLARINKQRFPPLNLLNHHLTHTYSAFFTSPYDEAAILVVDGSGSQVQGSRVPQRETMTFSAGSGNDITTLGGVSGESTGVGFSPEYPPLFENSLGHMYRAVTQVLGFGWMSAGTAMALASFGDTRYVDDVMRYIRLLPEGRYAVRIGGRDGLLSQLGHWRDEGHAKGDRFQVDTALAAAVQIGLETVMIHALDYLWEKTQAPKLCLAGGVALNGLLNGQIARRTQFKNVHVVFAPGDGGTALGAALWDYVRRHGSVSKPIRFQSGPFLGRTYERAAIKNALDAKGVVARSPSNLHDVVARLIAAGKIVAWYEGAAEFGPRALGHRSILADPRDAQMLHRINKIKGREWFRPVAPAVTEESAATYFEVDCYSPYMQFVWPVREQYRAALPAITHIDGSARIQSVRKRGNESLHALLRAFEEITSFPILINTSLNIRGGPIAETPSNAIDVFLASELDVLVAGEYVVQK